VYNENTKTILVYTNAIIAANLTNVNVNVSTVVDARNFLGRSLFLADPMLIGAIDDFRIYYGNMSAAQVAASFAAGPDAERVTATLNGSNVIITWPDVPVLAGYSLQYAPTLTPPVNWVGAGGSTIVGGNNQVSIPLTNSQSYFRLIK
jgi:hypothetical protein